MELLKFLEGIRSPFFNAVIGLATRLGEESIAIIILCAVFWCVSKKAAYRIGIAYFLSGLTVQGMKIIFRIERPWVLYPNLNPVQSAIDHATGYSFPSGHTQSAAALFGTLGALVKQIPLKIIFFFLILLVVFSRMYLGVHTLSDVSVSLLISLFVILFSIKIISGDKINKKREAAIALVLVLYAAIMIVIAAVLYSRGRIEHVYLTDCLKAAGAGIGFAAGMFIERVYINFSVNAKNLLLQIIKFILGIAGVLAIKEGLKLAAGTGFIIDTIRYFLMLMWITVFFPLIIKRFFSVSSTK